MPTKKPGIIEALALMAHIKQLSLALERTEDGQETRWQLLQGWLADHPQYRKLVEKCVKQSPSDALQTILAETEIEPIVIEAIDRNGKIRTIAISAIETIQQLYRERAGIAQGEIAQ